MQARRRRIQSDNAPKGMGDQILGLSLFVMMLAFFIVLNAISTYQKKKIETVAQGVTQAFSTEITQGLEKKPSMVASEQKSLGEGDTIEKIGGMFKSQIAAAEITPNKQNGTMVIRIKLSDFKNVLAGASTPGKQTESGRQFLQTLASLLRANNRGTPYRMDMTFYMKANPARIQNEDPQAMQAMIRTVSGFAETIEQMGLPAHLMTVGLQKGDSEIVELFFRRHTPTRARDILGGQNG